MKAKKTEDSINREIEHLEINLRQKKNELAKIKKEIEKQEDRHRELEKCASEFIEHISCELNLYDPPFFEDGLVVRDGLPEADENSPALEDGIYLAGVKNAEGERRIYPIDGSSYSFHKVVVSFVMDVIDVDHILEDSFTYD